MQEGISIGNVEILSVVDMYSAPQVPSEFFPDVSEDEWGPYRAEQLTPEGAIILPYCHFAIRSQDQVIMVDTGIGAGPHPGISNQTGNLINDLTRVGIYPDQVDVVVHTHLHADHVGWNLNYESGAPKPTFHNARYLVPRVDWEHFSQSEVLNLAENKHVLDQVIPLEELGVMELVDGGHAITSEVSTIDTPGHTPGHQCILINSQGERAAVVGDVFHMSIQVERPDWCVHVDVDKAAGQKCREDLLDQSERDGMIIAAGHFKVDQHFGRAVRREGRRYWQVL